MADKPSRSLIVFGDGLARFIDPSSHINLHSLASNAFCGFLSLPNSPLSESEEERIVREFAVLLDACDACLNTSGNQDNAPKQTLPDRFMGMKAAILTNNSGLKSFSAKLGFSVLELDELLKTNELQDIVVLELLKLLGFQEGKVVDDNYFDLIFLHVGAGEKVDSNDQKEIDTEMEYVNGLVGEIMSQAQPGSDVGSRLHLSVVMSYGNVLEGDDSKYSVSKRADEKNSYLSELFPLQSYAMKGGSPRKDVRHHCPMLIAQWQHAVTRKDETQKFSFEDFKEHCGNLTIPADRFLHEIAFKLWKAPKYGA
ncbi:hypothetical protein HN51_017405 [Arachis hypogaea]|uniref:Uncharacterized protein n=1 Tax=Arachis hypogaea TaxID=3818 RepID=A0A445CX98_ARAHY|nr:uncharacterized protein LOC107605510 [Arachis ipaensis]XP_025660054.1 uncharacterized protein LOC112755931 isoform X1 [Arachis hypogaea]QHN88748.1 uncharacterized protein DS421_16g566060 [Arachis hypogaea]RYR55501.1 hypothetical protein Ahy_A06g030708 [Arachis hypogaea]